MKGWNLFFGTVIALIFPLFIVPGLFGLQNFTQWGAMYTNHWCTATLMSTPVPDPDLTPPEGILMEQERGTSARRATWYDGMHNTVSCTAWARSFCGKISKGGWPVAASYAYFRGRYLQNEMNLCDLPPSQSDYWFPR